jgi:hypothetical protein
VVLSIIAGALQVLAIGACVILYFCKLENIAWIIFILTYFVVTILYVILFVSIRLSKVK